MARWKNDWGKEFEDEDTARENVCENMTWDDYEEYFQYNVSFHDLFEHLKKMPNFFESFEDVFWATEDEFFKDNYHKIDEDEDEDEEEDEQSSF